MDFLPIVEVVNPSVTLDQFPIPVVDSVTTLRRIHYRHGRRTSSTGRTRGVRPDDCWRERTSTPLNYSSSVFSAGRKGRVSRVTYPSVEGARDSFGEVVPRRPETFTVNEGTDYRGFPSWPGVVSTQTQSSSLPTCVDCDVTDRIKTAGSGSCHRPKDV